MGYGLPPLHPQWIEATKEMGAPPSVSHNDVAESRAHFFAIFDALAKIRQEPAEMKSVEAHDIHIDGNIRVRVYVPPKSNATSASCNSGGLPVGLYIHSGGWYTGSIDAEDFLCRDIAYSANIILFSPEYRLAPENPYPAGLEDCLETYKYMHTRAAEYGGSSLHKFIMGGSAGGNLAACVALAYASDPELRPAGVMLSCMTSCDPLALPVPYKERYFPEQYLETPVIDTKTVQLARDWLQPPAPSHPLYSPLLHPDIKLLPPVYITAMTNDPSHPETIFFYEECKQQGVQADLVEWEGLPHFFWILPHMAKSREYMEVWNEKLRGLISQASKRRE